MYRLVFAGLSDHLVVELAVHAPDDTPVVFFGDAPAVLSQSVSLNGVPEQIDHCRSQCCAVPDREEAGGVLGQVAKGLEIRGDDRGAETGAGAPRSFPVAASVIWTWNRSSSPTA